MKTDFAFWYDVATENFWGSHICIKDDPYFIQMQSILDKVDTSIEQ